MSEYIPKVFQWTVSNGVITIEKQQDKSTFCFGVDDNFSPLENPRLQELVDWIDDGYDVEDLSKTLARCAAWSKKG